MVLDPGTFYVDTDILPDLFFPVLPDIYILPRFVHLMLVLIEGRQVVRETERDVPVIGKHIFHRRAQRARQRIGKRGEIVCLRQADIVFRQPRIVAGDLQFRIVLVSLPHIFVTAFERYRRVKQPRIGLEQQGFIQSEDDIQLLGDDGDIIVRFPVSQLVVSQLQLTAQLVVAGDDPLFLQTADIFQPSRRLLHVPGEYLFLLVQAEQIHIAATALFRLCRWSNLKRQSAFPATSV